MAGIIDQLDGLVLNSLQSNVFSDTNPYLTSLAAQKSPRSPNDNQVFAGDQRLNGPATPRITPKEGDIRLRGKESFAKGNIYDDRDFNINLEGGGKYAPLAQATPIANYIDIFSVAHWLRNIGTEFGLLPGKHTEDRGRRLAKFASYAGVMLAEGLMNPGDPQLGGFANQIANPLSFVIASVPLIRATPIGSSPNVAAATGLEYVSNFKLIPAASERLLLMRNGLYVKALDLSQVSKLDIQPPGFFGDISSAPGYGAQGNTLQKPGLNPPLLGGTVAAQVDGGSITDFFTADLVHTNVYNSARKYLDSPVITQKKLEEALEVMPPPTSPRERESVHIQTVFTNRRFPGAPAGKTLTDQDYTFVTKARKQTVNDKFEPEDIAAGPGNVDMRIHNSENPDSGLVAADQYGKSVIPDSELYMPFCFQDLRNIADSAIGLDKYVYFRAFLKSNISETFTPDWQAERYFGRTEQIPIYQGTARNLALSFDIVAWGPQDLPLMYKKLHKLQSMVYPLYDTKGYMQAAPLIRMRVGDLFASRSKLGLPGYITSLDFAFDDGIWNLKTDFKVPRKVTVSLAFTVLHEGNPGIYTRGARVEDDGTVVESGVPGPTFGTAATFPDTQDVGGDETGIRGILAAARA